MGHLMRFIVFLNQIAASAAIDQINSNGRTLFAAQGYVVDQNGNIESKRLSDGSIDSSSKTTTWDIARQRLDSKWIVSHPENAMRSATVIDGQGTTGAQYVMVGVVYDTIEEYSDTWFAA